MPILPPQQKIRASRVQAMLQKSQDGLVVDRQKIEEMFNLQMKVKQGGISAQALNDFVMGKTKDRLEKIKDLRQNQTKILPLYLEAKKLVAKHQKCLSTIIKEDSDHIPF